MAFGNFGSESKPHIGSDFTINQYENAPANYQKDNDMGLTAASATFTFKSDNPTDYDDGVITIVSSAGTGKAYQFQDDGADTTGTIDSGAVVVQINGYSSKGAIMAELATAINHENGHNGGSANSVLSLTLSAPAGQNATLGITQVVAGDAGNTNIGQIDVIFSALEVPSPGFTGGVDGQQFDAQVPFSLGLSGVLPFNIGSVASRSAYTMTKGKQISTE
jgi:hypothetical protein